MEDLESIRVFTGEENLTSDELSILMDHEDEFSRKATTFSNLSVSWTRILSDA